MLYDEGEGRNDWGGWGALLCCWGGSILSDEGPSINVRVHIQSWITSYISRVRNVAVFGVLLALAASPIVWLLQFHRVPVLKRRS